MGPVDAGIDSLGFCWTTSHDEAGFAVAGGVLGVAAGAGAGEGALATGAGAAAGATGDDAGGAGDDVIRTRSGGAGAAAPLAMGAHDGRFDPGH